jgi:hypothetical protein
MSLSWSPKIRARVAARSRRRSAIHEAGHAVVARHLGVAVISCWIAVDNDAKLGLRGISWRGNTKTFGAATKTANRLIAVAGAAAENCWSGEFKAIDVPWDLDDSSMSYSDWAGTGCEPGEPDRECLKAFDRVTGLLCRGRPLWNELLLTARTLIMDGCLPLYWGVPDEMLRAARYGAAA